MKFSLFHKQKQPEEPEKAAAPKEEPKKQADTSAEPKTQETQPITTPTQESAVAPPQEQKPEAAEPASKTYLKAMPLKELTDVENVKEEVKNGNIIILRVTPLANKNIDDVKNAVNQLYEFAESVGGDIARLGEERVVICPKNIRIWREKTPPAPNDTLPTAAPTAA